MSLRAAGLGAVSLFLIIFLSASILGIGFQSLLYPQAYEKAMESSGAYKLVEEKISESTYGLSVLFVTQNDIKQMTIQLLSSILAYVRSESDVLDLKLSLGKTAREAVEGAINSLPSCETPQFTFTPDIKCKPRGVSTSALADLIMQNTVIVPSQQLEIDLSKYAPELESALQKIRPQVKLLMNALAVAVALSALLVLILIIANRRSARSAAKWLGACLVISGAVSLVLSAMLNSTVISMLSENGLPAASGLINELISYAAKTSSTYALAVLVLGIILTTASFAFRGGAEPKRVRSGKSKK